MNYFLNALSLRLSEMPYLFIALLFCFTLHEFAHASVAKFLGDNGPKADGRLSLNPIRHIDPKGFFLMLLIGIGWSKPVEINESSYRNSNDYTLAMLAGPFMNLLLAIFSILSFTFLAWAMDTCFLKTTNPSLLLRFWEVIAHFLSIFLQINIFFLVFNLLPLPGLDGFHLWRHVLGNPAWFFETFANPLISLMLLLSILCGFLPIEQWAYFITRGLVNFIAKFFPLF